MKSQLHRLAVLPILIASTVTAMAGPFRSNVIVGVANQPDLVLEVPEGKAVTILSFLSNDLGKLSVTKGSKTTNVLASTYVDDTPTANGKDIVIAGPATITAEVVTGQTAFLSYKLYAN